MKTLRYSTIKKNIDSFFKHPFTSAGEKNFEFFGNFAPQRS